MRKYKFENLFDIFGEDPEYFAPFSLRTNLFYGQNFAAPQPMPVFADTNLTNGEDKYTTVMEDETVYALDGNDNIEVRHDDVGVYGGAGDDVLRIEDHQNFATIDTVFDGGNGYDTANFVILTVIGQDTFISLNVRNMSFNAVESSTLTFEQDPNDPGDGGAGGELVYDFFRINANQISGLEYLEVPDGLEIEVYLNSTNSVVDFRGLEVENSHYINLYNFGPNDKDFYLSGVNINYASLGSWEDSVFVTYDPTQIWRAEFEEWDPNTSGKDIVDFSLMETVSDGMGGTLRLLTHGMTQVTQTGLGLAADSWVKISNIDEYYGWDGEDIFIGDARDNYFDGNGGNDAAIYSSANLADYTVTEISAGVYTIEAIGGTGEGTDTLTDIEFIRLGGVDGTDYDISMFAAPEPNVINGTSSSEELTGTNGDDIINGNGGVDQYYGLAGDDVYNGGTSNDFFYNSQGDDIAYGNEGNDRFQYWGVDNIVLDAEIFYGGLGNDIVGVSSLPNSVTSYFLDARPDADGFGNASFGFQFQSVEEFSISLINTVDTIWTLDGEDYIFVGLGNDFVNAGGGDDSIYGSYGNDVLYGGAGNDIIFGDQNGASGSNNNDEIYGGDGDDQIDGQIGDDEIYGGAGIDFILGGSGNDLIDGGEGNDLIAGGLGADVINGGDGQDVVTYQYATAGITAIIGEASLNTGEAVGDSYIDVENLTGSEFDDILGGDTNANIIDGRDGFDIVSYAYASSAIVFGGLGLIASSGDIVDDTLINIEAIEGTAFNDRLFGGNDASIFYGGEGNDRLFGRNGDDMLYGEGGNDVIIAGRDNDLLDGGDGDDQLRGNEGDDTIYGGDGNDAITGGAGADFMDGGAGIDRVEYTYGTHAGVTASLGDSSINTGDAAGDTYINIENLYGTSFDDVLHGDAGNNRIEGRRGDDMLFGGEGTDYLRGGAGDDVMNGEGGNDLLLGQAGADIYQFDANHGTDRIFVFTQGEDLIEFTESVFDFSDLTLTQDGTSVSIDTGEGTILVYNSIVADFTADDFTFATPPPPAQEPLDMGEQDIAMWVEVDALL